MSWGGEGRGGKEEEEEGGRELGQGGDADLGPGARPPALWGTSPGASAAAELVPGPAPSPFSLLNSHPLASPACSSFSPSHLLWTRFRSPCSFHLCPPFLFLFWPISHRLRLFLISGVLCLSPFCPIPSTVPSSFSLGFFVSVCDIVTFSYSCAHCSLSSVTLSFLSLSLSPPFLFLFGPLLMFSCSVSLSSPIACLSVLSDPLGPHGLQPPGSSVRGILQARILEWVAIPFSRGSSPSRD